MTEMDFRERYSRIIEYYQYIEMRLRFICAAVFKDDTRSWYERLGDYESDTLGRLTKLLKDFQSDGQAVLFSSEDFDALDELRSKRNYWVHQCFSDPSHVTFSRKGELRNADYGKRLALDLFSVK